MTETLAPSPACFEGEPDLACRTVVIVPARNEEASLPRTLEALRNQVDCAGAPIDAASYEVLLLLNNCTDRSADSARNFAGKHPDFRLRIEQREFASEEAHVGTARRLLMDAACARLAGRGETECILLSTDADTVVAPDWIARNWLHIGSGAEVVGGVINLFPHEIETLEAGTRAAYLRDRRFQQLVARLESLLDPDPADPWPRHLEHFGASLACTCEVYRRAGGMPAVKPLEDVAFVDALRKVGARIRHAVDVHIFTSARLDGRAEVGLSGQLRHWQADCTAGVPHQVESAGWLAHRFRTLRALRELNRGGEPGSLEAWPVAWRERLARKVSEGLPDAKFLELLDCNALVAESFAGERTSEIEACCAQLEELVTAAEMEVSARDGLHKSQSKSRRLKPLPSNSLSGGAEARPYQKQT